MPDPETTQQMPREVYDGFYWWKARVLEVTSWRGTQRWQAVLDRHFGGLISHSHWLSIVPAAKKGKKRKDRAVAVFDANSMLDAHEQHLELDRGEHV